MSGPSPEYVEDLTVDSTEALTGAVWAKVIRPTPDFRVELADQLCEFLLKLPLLDQQRLLSGNQRVAIRQFSRQYG